MAVFDFTIKEGTTKRIQLAGEDANSDPYDYTSSTVEFIAKTNSAATLASLEFELVVNGAGVGTPTPASRMFLGRPDPDNYDGALLDTAATTGYITIRFAPADTLTLVTTANKNFVWEARVTTAGADAYTLGSGTITVEDSLFDN